MTIQPRLVFLAVKIKPIKQRRNYVNVSLGLLKSMECVNFVARMGFLMEVGVSVCRGILEMGKFVGRIPRSRIRRLG